MVNESLEIAEFVGSPKLTFSDTGMNHLSEILLNSQSYDLIFTTSGNFIFEGWVFSWSNYLMMFLIILLIIWNIYLTVKLKKITQSKSKASSGGKK